MKSLSLYGLLLLILLNSSGLHAQRILISEPDRENSRRINFEIIGKMGNNFLIYKSIRSENFVCVYDQDMKQIKE